MKKVILLITLFLVLSAVYIISNIDRKKNIDICSEIAKIRTVPFQGEYVDDESYNKIIENKESYIECLLDNILNITPMKDPRKAPPYNGFTIGDMAFFLIVKLNNLKFGAILPVNVQKKLKKQGIYAYFEYVKSFNNRIQLHQNVKSVINH